MNKINRVYYINLDHRIDRKTSIENEFLKMDISNYARFPAVSYNPGPVGCHMSHLSVLKTARENKWKNCMIVEDDFIFTISKDEFNIQLDHLFTHFSDFDVVMLAYNMNKCKPIDNILGKVEDVQTAACYIVNCKFYDALIDNLEKALTLHIETKNAALYTNDQCWKVLQPHSKWYYFINRCGRQREDYSDNEKRVINYGV